MTKFIAFGDSNINILSPLKNKNFKIYKFKGISMRSLLSNHRDKILEKCKKKYYDYGFFMFGVVDINFYYYYKKYHDNQQDILEQIYARTKEYVEFINSLPIKNKYINWCITKSCSN